MTVRQIIGDCREELRRLEAESVHCVVTSPPYWGLRDYKIPPSIWGGDPKCEHEFSAVTTPARTGGTNCSTLGHYNNALSPQMIEKKIKQQMVPASVSGFCIYCNAWRGCYGLEPTYQLYIEHTVEIFREVWRVLRKDGTLWLNMGDCYATSPAGWSADRYKDEG